MHPSTSTARALLDAGNPRGAIEEARKALASNPEDVAAGVVVAHAYMRMSKPAESREAALDVLRNDPNNLPALRLLAASYTLQKKNGKALPLAEQMIQLAPEEPDGFLTRAICNEQSGKFDAAERDYRLALERDPGGTTNTRALFADFLIDRGRLDAAEELSDELTGHDAGSVDAVLLRAALALRQGRTADAREDTLWALSQDAENQNAIQLLAQIKMKSSPITGIWWRYAVWMGRFSRGKQWMIIIGLYLGWKLTSTALTIAGLGLFAAPLTLLWFAFCVLTWVCPWLLKRMVNKELKSVEVKPF